MKKKLLGLTGALAVAALASWSAPAAALSFCHLRVCLGKDPSTPCYCLNDHSKIVTCGTFQTSC